MPAPAPASVRHARLLGLAAIGWLGFNFPLITLWDQRVTVLGIPLMGLALFVGWALLLAAAAWVVERGDDDEADGRATDAEDSGGAAPASGIHTTL